MSLYLKIFILTSAKRLYNKRLRIHTFAWTYFFVLVIYTEAYCNLFVFYVIKIYDFVGLDVSTKILKNISFGKHRDYLIMNVIKYSSYIFFAQYFNTVPI